MTRLPYLVAVLLFLFSLAVKSAEPPQERIFILAGQSNMMGRGQTAKLPDELRVQPENVKFYTHGRQSTIAKYHTFGPEVRFAHAMSQTFPNDKIIIIKSVASGSAIEEWLPGSQLYEGLIRQVKFVNPESKGIEAILWMQGETDARNAETAEKYQDNLSTFINNLRTDLKANETPVLVGKITQKDINFPMEQQVRAAQEAVCEEIPNTHIVSTDGLSKIYDRVHYDANGLVELGRRFAMVFIQQRKQQLLADISSKNTSN